MNRGNQQIKLLVRQNAGTIACMDSGAVASPWGIASFLRTVAMKSIGRSTHDKSLLSEEPDEGKNHALSAVEGFHVRLPDKERQDRRE